MEKDINKLITFLKEKGFVYSGSQIYGGLANSWDFGPLGSLLKENIKSEWTNHFVKKNPVTSYMLDSSIFLNTNVWKASGHYSKFNDPLIDCKVCKSRYRADHLLEDAGVDISNKSLDDLTKLIKKHKILCSKCKDKTNWTEVRNFELMFKTHFSKTNEDEVVFLRPETAQGVFINFKNVVNSVNPKLPFGIGQIGKAFRNEITPGNFIFRTKEFEQMEYEFFIEPKNDAKEFKNLLKKIDEFLKAVGLSKTNLQKFDVPKEELAHYSKQTIDYKFNFPFGWSELLGLANRGDFDLKNHTQHSNEELSIRNDKNEKVTPFILEASFGIERLMLAILLSAYKVDKKTEREVLSLPYNLAPYKVAVCPLSSEHVDYAETLYHDLFKENISMIRYDKSGSIGKRYFRNDAIGTKFVITIDNDSLKKNVVTIRDRDTTLQAKVKTKDIVKYITENATK